MKEYEENKEKLSGKDEQERKLIESLNNIHSKYIKKNPNEKDRYLDFCSDLKKCLEDNVLKRKKSLGSHFKSSSSNSMSKDIIKLLEYAENILKGKNLKSNKNKFDKSCKNIINSLEKLKNKKSGDHMPLFAKSKINKVLTEIVSSLEKDISNYCE